MELTPHNFGIPPLDVVVPPQKVEAARLVEPLKLPENVVVRPVDVVEVAVFPQFIPVAGLDVEEALAEVPPERVSHHDLVVGEVVGPAVVTPVAVTENDDTRRVVEDQRRVPCQLNDFG